MNGKIHIYTGNGKGKTTAALGLAFRAAAYGYKTYVGQFMKGQSYGELRMSKKLSWIDIEQFGDDTMIHVIHPPDNKNIDLAKNGVSKSRDAMFSDEYQIIVLDEILIAEYFNLIDIKDIISLIEEKPEHIEMILTGRYANEELYGYVDLVTEMKEIKHYYQQELLAREGIEK